MTTATITYRPFPTEVWNARLGVRLHLALRLMFHRAPAKNRTATLSQSLQLPHAPFPLENRRLLISVH